MNKLAHDDTLNKLGPQRIFADQQLNQIAFPLGGIGTGCVCLSGFGGLKDWHIFNRPNYGSTLPKTFPIIWAQETNKPSMCKVLEGPIAPPFTKDGNGEPCKSGEGLPHMDNCTFQGEFPFAMVDFECKSLPVQVSLEAYSPFIPSNPDDSGFPVAVLKYMVRNVAANPVKCTVAWNLMNAVGSIGNAENEKNIGPIQYGSAGNVNSYVEKDGVRGILLTTQGWAKDHPRYGSMGIFTPDSDFSLTYTESWLRAGWFSAMHEFWDKFSVSGTFPQHKYGAAGMNGGDACGLGVQLNLAPGESKMVTFIISWYFPIFEQYWKVKPLPNGFLMNPEDEVPPPPIWKNYYANQFSDALDVAVKLTQNEYRLYDTSKKFHDTFFGSSYPPYVLDAISSNLGILRSPTCLRLEDGTFYGFEGCNNTQGCCEGSCTHVWNYQQALAFLFPSLERSMREADYKYNFRQDDSLCFRLQLPLGSFPNTFHAAADGQLGGIIKVFRDWKIYGNKDWLKSLWPSVKRALEFAWKEWDKNKDGLMEGSQHNTYDINFLGPNPMTGCFYLGALLAGSEIAKEVGEPQKSLEYYGLYKKGQELFEKELFNKEYFIQKYDPKEAPEYQFGIGCLSDQLLGQWLSEISGLGYLFDKSKVKSALDAIIRYNWRSDLSNHPNMQRVYAAGHESGLILCTWPMGGRPAIPFPYSDEVWTGFEYQVASHCILEGLVDEGLTIVRSARKRHDGFKRNPYDEYECGHHYARAMSSYGLLLALSGFSVDMHQGLLGFAPVINSKNFTTFWAIDNAWGKYVQSYVKGILTVLYGKLELRKLRLPEYASKQLEFKWENKKIKVTVAADGLITFLIKIELKAGDSLEFMPLP